MQHPRKNRSVRTDNKVWWKYPTALFFETRGEQLELAPTAWRTFEDVDLQDKKLKWYGIGKNYIRHMITIPITDLPGAF